MPHTPLHSALAAVAALLLAAPLAHAQQPDKKTLNPAAAPAPALALAPPPAGPHPPKPGPAGSHKARVQQLSDFAGTLTEYTASGDEQLIDAFALKTSTGTETVRFPRHLAQSLMAAAKAGSTVTLTGFRDTDPQGKTTLHFVSLTAGGQTVRDTPPVRPATPPTEEAATVRGTVQRLLTDPKGKANGLVLSDGTLLRLPPSAAEQLGEKLKTGATVAATGTLRTPGPGEVATKPVRIVRVQTITLDGVQFLVQ